MKLTEMSSETKVFLGVIAIAAAAIAVVCVCVWAATERPHLGPPAFYSQEKVHYIDNPELVGRVLGRNGYDQYWVQWVAESSSTGMLGGRVRVSPFTQKLHDKWELVRVEESTNETD